MIWRHRYTRADLTMANAFTAARIVLIPIFGWLWLRREDERALWVFCVAAATWPLTAKWVRKASTSVAPSADG